MDKSDIGKAGVPQWMRVELGKVREFARAIRDDNPLYFDLKLAERELGGMMPPPTFTMTLAHWDDGRGRPALGLDLRRVLHGEQEFEYLGPIYVGDELTATTTVKDIYTKQGSRGGTMTFVVFETTFVNQRGETALVARATLIQTAAPLKD